MPIYDYKCLGCGEEFEALVLKEPASCPSCAGKNLEQLISTFRVDSEGVRKINAVDAHRKNAKVRKEHQIAQAEYERNHHH